MSGAKLEEVLKTFQTNILAGVDERLETIRNGLGFEAPASQAADLLNDLADEANESVPVYGQGKYPAFVYAVDSDTQKFWCVPRSFTFPKVNRYEGWKFWILGMPNYKEKAPDGTERAHPIMPFRLFDPKLMPNSAKSAYRINWLPIFSIMDSAVVDSEEHEFTSHDVDRLFAEGTDILRTRASYCFEDSNKHRLWSVSTWSKKVSASFINKFGTQQDKLALPPPKNNFCRKSRTSKGRKRPLKEHNTHPRRNGNDSSSDEESSTSPRSNEPPPRRPRRASPPLVESPRRTSPRRRATSSVATTAVPQPLTEEEKQRVISAARKDTLEESVSYMVRHLMARWRESGDPEPTAINEVEELAMRHRKLTSSSTTSFVQPANTSNEQKSNDDSSLSSDEDFCVADHSSDESDDRIMAAFDTK